MFCPDTSSGVPKLFVGGLPPSLTESELAKVIKRIGEAKVNLVKRSHSQLNSGFAFVIPGSRETASLLLASEIYIQGRCLQFQVSSGKKSLENLSGKRLFMRNLPYSISNEELADFFSKYCNIRAAYSILDTYGWSKGFGFIDFYDSVSTKIILDIGIFKIHGTLITVEEFNPQHRESESAKVLKTTQPAKPEVINVEEKKVPPSSDTQITNKISCSISQRQAGVSMKEELKIMFNEVEEDGRIRKEFFERATSKLSHSTPHVRFNLLCRYIRPIQNTKKATASGVSQIKPQSESKKGLTIKKESVVPSES